MKKSLIVLASMLVLFLSACNYQNESNYNDKSIINHPIVGVWNLISSDSYDYNGVHVLDIIEMMEERDELHYMEMPLIIRNDGTVNANGIESNWNIRDERFLYAWDSGGYYSFEESRLVITEYMPDGSFLRRVYERVE